MLFPLPYTLPLILDLAPSSSYNLLRESEKMVKLLNN